MRRLPPYMIVAVCGILFLSAGMVIITADSTDPSAQPTATVDMPTPTDAVSALVVVQPTDVFVQPIVQPTVIQPTVEQIAPVVAPTDVVQPVQPTALVEQQQAPPTTVVDAQVQAPPPAAPIVPATPVPVDTAGVVVTPVIEQPGTLLGTLPPPPNVENPVVIPTLELPTIQPTVVAMMQVAGQIGAPLRADYSGIAVMLTLPDGSALQTTTDGAGNFTFADLAAGMYRVDAGAAGYLTSQTTFMLPEGQNVVLPSAMLVGGDTNLDNKIDLTDAALIAANFDSASVVAGADLNHDGIVDIRDLTAIGAYFGLSGPTQWKS